MAQSFLQSVGWEQFQQALGRKTQRLEGALFIQHPLRFGLEYWYAPRVSMAPEVAKVDAMKGKKTVFTLIEPEEGEPVAPYVATYSRQPRQTLLTDLSQPVETLLAKMKSKTRYNIGLAERKGVQTFVFTYPQSLEYLPVFMALTHETNVRNYIKSHTEEYYRTLLEVLGKTGQASLHIAYVNDQPISALVLIRHDGVATYLFGASGGEDRNVMSSYLLQWKAMQYAKSLGDTVYDWWGVMVDVKMGIGAAGSDNANTSQITPAPGRGYGVTRFKLGFGGMVNVYPPAVVRPYKAFWYAVYNAMHRKHGGFSY